MTVVTAFSIGGLALVVGLLAAIVIRRLRGVKPDAYELTEIPDDLRKRIPVSLHPEIDPALCIGSGACVPACPEGRILRLYDGHSHLVEPESCIGHGACARECPVQAISLVFGTATRGIDIPHVTEHFETNVPGVYIAGELGGMGLIRNAVSQGTQAVAHIAKKAKSQDPNVLDIVIVGAGPAGLAAGLEAQRRELRVAILDQEESPGGTVAHYPRKKIVMLGALDMGGHRITRREIGKEELIAFWEGVIESAGLDIRFQEQMKAIEREGEVLTVQTSTQAFRARQVILCIGRRGTPRKLGVSGEDLPKVAYSMREPEVWAGMKVLVVGGGDSALEAAVTLSEQPETTVTLSYRGDRIFRAKPKNLKRLDAAIAAQQLECVLQSTVASVAPDHVRLNTPGGERILDNDQVFVFAGGVLPTKLLAGVGIQMERKFGTR